MTAGGGEMERICDNCRWRLLLTNFKPCSDCSHIQEVFDRWQPAVPVEPMEVKDATVAKEQER